jgi:DNA replication protein DnaC
MIEEINEARELADLRKYRAQINAADLLLIEDLFLRRLPSNAVDELADVLMSRYEKSSVIITSNRMIDESSSHPCSTASCTTAWRILVFLVCLDLRKGRTGGSGSPVTLLP